MRKKPNLTKTVDDLVRAVKAANLAMYEAMLATGHPNPTPRYFTLHENRVSLTELTARLTKQFGPAVAEVR
jgi:hypothetical protein